MNYKTVADLPAPKTGKVDWRGLAEFARAHPGQWVEAPVPLSAGVPYQLTQDAYKDIPMAEFEVTSRKTDPSPEGARRCLVYVRTRS